MPCVSYAGGFSRNVCARVRLAVRRPEPRARVGRVPRLHGVYVLVCACAREREREKVRVLLLPVAKSMSAYLRAWLGIHDSYMYFKRHSYNILRAGVGI